MNLDALNTVGDLNFHVLTKVAFFILLTYILWYVFTDEQIVTSVLIVRLMSVAVT